MSEPMREPRLTKVDSETAPPVENLQVLKQVEESGVETNAHEQALQQVRTLRQHLEVQQKHLETSRTGLRKLFETVRSWWKKEEQLETTVARLAIEMDHLEDQIHHASSEQVQQHLQKRVEVLREQVNRIQLASVEVDQFMEQGIETKELDQSFPTEVAGASKKWNETTVNAGKLGKYGQDVLRSNPELGIGVVADGSSSAIDSYEVARRTSRRAQNILEDIPLESVHSVEEVERYLSSAVDMLLEEIRQMPADIKGATTLLATRYLEKFDTVVMIDIGDCEGAIVVGDVVEVLKPHLDHTNTADSIVKSVKAVKFKRDSNRPFVHSYSLAKLREQYPGVPIRILLATDGLQNNTKQTLEQMAQEIITKGPRVFTQKIQDRVQTIVRENAYTKEKEEVTVPVPLDDDMVVLDMTIPAKLVTGQAGEIIAA